MSGKPPTSPSTAGPTRPCHAAFPPRPAIPSFSFLTVLGTLAGETTTQELPHRPREAQNERGSRTDPGDRSGHSSRLVVLDRGKERGFFTAESLDQYLVGLVVLLGLVATVWAIANIGPIGLLAPVPLTLLMLAAFKIWDILRHQAAVREMLKPRANDTLAPAVLTPDIPVADESAPSTSGGDKTEWRSPSAAQQRPAI